MVLFVETQTSSSWIKGINAIANREGKGKVGVKGKVKRGDWRAFEPPVVKSWVT